VTCTQLAGRAYIIVQKQEIRQMGRKRKTNQQPGQLHTDADTAMTGCAILFTPQTALDHRVAKHGCTGRYITFVSVTIAPAFMTSCPYILAEGECSNTRVSYLLARAWRFDTARRGSPVRDGCIALCSVRQEQLPDPKVVARCPVFSLGIPVVELAH